VEAGATNGGDETEGVADFPFAGDWVGVVVKIFPFPNSVNNLFDY
jgi:hypothetical protein